MITRLRHGIANLLRAITRRCTRWAEWLDPPATGDLHELLAVMAHVKAGRIRRRRGESDARFAARLVRGDFELHTNLIDFSIERAKRMRKPTKESASRF